MKKLNNLSEASFLRAFFAAVSLIFIVAAFCMPDLKDLVIGTEIIWKYPCKVTSNYFHMGGFAATFQIGRAHV